MSIEQPEHPRLYECPKCGQRRALDGEDQCQTCYIKLLERLLAEQKAKPLNIINMQDDVCECRFCHKRNAIIKTNEGLALPISLETGEVVGSDFSGEWAGMPCCSCCYEKYNKD
jgi:hypothetical protein